MPYTYMIGWKNLNTFYYGVRYAKRCNPLELFVTYFTSSKHVHRFIEENGQPDIIQIRKIFECPNKARIWESKVLKRLNVVNRKDFINKTDNVSISHERALIGSHHSGYVLSDETKDKIRNKALGRSRSIESREKQSKSLMGSKNHFYGKTHSDEFKKTQSERQKTRMVGAGNNRAIAIRYDGKTYGTLKEFSKDSGISIYHVRKMVQNESLELV